MFCFAVTPSNFLESIADWGEDAVPILEYILKDKKKGDFSGKIKFKKCQDYTHPCDLDLIKRHLDVSNLQCCGTSRCRGSAHVNLGTKCNLYTCQPAGWTGKDY